MIYSINCCVLDNCDCICIVCLVFIRLLSLIWIHFILVMIELIRMNKLYSESYKIMTGQVNQCIRTFYEHYNLSHYDFSETLHLTNIFNSVKCKLRLLTLRIISIFSLSVVYYVGLAIQWLIRLEEYNICGQSSFPFQKRTSKSWIDRELCECRK